MNPRTLAVALLVTPILALFRSWPTSSTTNRCPGTSPAIPGPTVIAVEGETVLVVRGSVQSGSGSDTRDFFSMTVAEGASLEAIRLVDYVDGDTGASGNTGYFMVDDGLDLGRAVEFELQHLPRRLALQPDALPDRGGEHARPALEGGQGEPASRTRSVRAPTRSTSSRPDPSGTSTSSASSSSATAARARPTRR